MRWRADPSLIGNTAKQNMTVHRWFAAKSCPGTWLYQRHGQIAADVNKLLTEDEDVERWKTIKDVPAGFYRNEAQRLMNEGVLKGKGNGEIDLTEDMLRTILIIERMIK